MKIFVFIIFLCLLFTGTVSALSPGIDLGVTVANPDISTAIYSKLVFTDCSNNSAPAGTLPSMGELDVDSTPDGAFVNLDGSPWTSKHCIGGWPTPTCFYLPVNTPYSGNVETGSHSITISRAGYKDYSGTVTICSQRVSYVHKTLTAVTTTTPTPTVTITSTTTGTPTATTTATTDVTTAITTTTAPVTVLTTATTISTPTATVSGSGTSTAAPESSGSLSITTTPAGAAVYIDGVQRGVSPATIPGLTAGSHTVLLKLNGYQDLATPVPITAGIINVFTTGLIPLPAGATAVPATPASGVPVTATKTQSPGFGAAAAACAVGVILLRKTKP